MTLNQFRESLLS